MNIQKAYNKAAGRVMAITMSVYGSKIILHFLGYNAGIAWDIDMYMFYACIGVATLTIFNLLMIKEEKKWA